MAIMATMTHKQVTERFKLDLAALCEKHNILITSDSNIHVEIDPVYITERGIYTEFGAEFDIGTRFDKDAAKEIRAKIEKTDWPSHTR